MLCSRIHQELLVRLAAERRHDPVGHTTNSCSTCATDSPAAADEHLAGIKLIKAPCEKLFYFSLLVSVWLLVGITSCKGSLCEAAIEQKSNTHTIRNCEGTYDTNFPMHICYLKAYTKRIIVFITVASVSTCSECMLIFLAV